MAEVKPNLIGGQWKTGEHASANVNPSDVDDVIGHFATASTDDVETAIAAADAAAYDWARSGIQARHDILRAASDEIMAQS